MRGRLERQPLQRVQWNAHVVRNRVERRSLARSRAGPDQVTQPLTDGGLTEDLEAHALGKQLNTARQP